MCPRLNLQFFMLVKNNFEFVILLLSLTKCWNYSQGPTDSFCDAGEYSLQSFIVCESKHFIKGAMSVGNKHVLKKEISMKI